jgi:acylphosphatase
MIHKNIQIFGRVQGVGFRYSARLAARNYGIKGFVRNMSDGSVYLEVEGSEDNVEKFINWCRVGPDFAYIDHVNIVDASLSNFESFEVRF